MQSKKYKHSLRPGGLKHSLRPYGLRRQFLKNIPILFLSCVLFFLLVGLFIFVFNFAVSKQNSFLSPLAQVKSSKNTNLDSLLVKNDIQYSKIEGEAVFLKDQGVVYLDLHQNLASQISSLQLILSRLTIEGKKFKKLDLRFDKPVIEF